MIKYAKLFLAIICSTCIIIGFAGCMQERELPNMPKLIVDGNEYQINKSTINDMSTIFTIQEYDNKYVEPGDPKHFMLISNQNDKMIVGVYNDSNISMTFEECKIFEITVTHDRFQNSQIEFSNGVGFNSEMKEITEIFGKSTSSTSDGLATTYCWAFADGTLYISIENGNGNLISLRMLSNVDPHTALLPETESTEPT